MPLQTPEEFSLSHAALVLLNPPLCLILPFGTADGFLQFFCPEQIVQSLRQFHEGSLPGSILHVNFFEPPRSKTWRIAATFVPFPWKPGRSCLAPGHRAQAFRRRSAPGKSESAGRCVRAIGAKPPSTALPLLSTRNRASGRQPLDGVQQFFVISFEYVNILLS